MSKLRTLHKRRKRKLFGSKIPDGLIRRLALCNRFAASDEGRSLMLYSRVLEPHRMSFKDAFYDVKDRLLSRYGKPKGYALQSWESERYSWYDDYSTTAYHSHILEIFKIGKLILHRPTGHFSYSTDDDYYKRSVGFRELADKCVQRINGKKKIKTHTITESQAKFALSWLIKLAIFKLDLPATETVKPKVISGDYYQDYLDKQHKKEQAEREKARAELADTIVLCDWCKCEFKYSEMKRTFDRAFCAECVSKVNPAETMPF